MLFRSVEAEGVEVEEKALRYIAKTADGSMRDALSLLDQCIAFHLGNTLTYDKVLDVLGAVDSKVFSDLLSYILERDVPGCISLLEDVVMQGRDLNQFVTDFTWYLRNLLLVQSSDDLEDVIDMSSDNLLRLKEEATRLSMDQIIRYIYIFSDLAGKIKYASQKRILIEIALIKLCKPQMETGKEAILDRIRQLEEQLESGVFVQGNAVPMSDNTVPAELPQKKPELPKAIPEDIKEVVTKWPAIVGSAQNPMKIYLKGATLSLGGDNGLLMVLEDGLASDYFIQHTENKEMLERLISDYIGKEVTVTVQAVSGKREIETTYVDLSQLIHMEIDEIEEE